MHASLKSIQLHKQNARNLRRLHKNEEDEAGVIPHPHLQKNKSWYRDIAGDCIRANTLSGGTRRLLKQVMPLIFHNPPLLWYPLISRREPNEFYLPRNTGRSCETELLHSTTSELIFSLRLQFIARELGVSSSGRHRCSKKKVSMNRLCLYRHISSIEWSQETIHSHSITCFWLYSNGWSRQGKLFSFWYLLKAYLIYFCQASYFF